MSIRIGPFDPIVLILNVLNALIKKGVITVADAKEIIKASLPAEMSAEERDRFVNSLFT